MGLQLSVIAWSANDRRFFHRQGPTKTAKLRLSASPLVHSSDWFNLIISLFVTSRWRQRDKRQPFKTFSTTFFFIVAIKTSVHSPKFNLYDILLVNLFLSAILLTLRYTTTNQWHTIPKGIHALKDVYLFFRHFAITVISCNIYLLLLLERLDLRLFS